MLLAPGTLMGWHWAGANLGPLGGAGTQHFTTVMLRLCLRIARRSVRVLLWERRCWCCVRGVCGGTISTFPARSSQQDHTRKRDHHDEALVERLDSSACAGKDQGSTSGERANKRPETSCPDASRSLSSTDRPRLFSDRQAGVWSKDLLHDERSCHSSTIPNTQPASAGTRRDFGAPCPEHAPLPCLLPKAKAVEQVWGVCLLRVIMNSPLRLLHP